VGSEKLEVQSEYASVVNRCIAELNTMAAAAQTTLAAAGANPQQQLRTVPCPPHLALSIARLLRRLTREVGADLAYHSTSRLVAITGDDLDKVEEAAVAVEKLCATEQGCSSKEEEAAAQKREAAAAKARAAEAAKAKAADAAAAAAVLAAATAAADKAHHGHAHAHSNSKHSKDSSKDKSIDHHHHRDHRHGSGDSATAGTALPPKGHRERGERGGRRSRPPLAPLRTESDTSNHEHDQSLGSGPPSYTPSESGSVGGTLMRTAALDSSEGADSPRAASVSSSSAGGGCCCASPVVAEMLRNGSTDSLFTEGSAPWAGISFSFSSSSSSGSGSNSSSSNDSSSSGSGSGGAAAAATGGGPCWDYYRQSWADNGASEQELLLSCASEHALDLSTVSFVPPPVRGHVIAGSSGSSGNSGGAAAAANALQMPPRPPALEPGLERAVFELLNALELAKYAPAFSNAEVRVSVLLNIIFDHTTTYVCITVAVLLIIELVALQ
jgi:trimeric autotransporter adhesin